jgi:hypothetical protein
MAESDDFPARELRQLGIEAVGCVQRTDPPDLASVAMRAVTTDEREGYQACVELLAEIVLGQGLRVPTWRRAREALERLGITEAPKAKTDAAR